MSIERDRLERTLVRRQQNVTEYETALASLDEKNIGTVRGNKWDKNNIDRSLELAKAEVATLTERLK